MRRRGSYPVGRCKLDPSLKATCFQPLTPESAYSAFAFNLNLISELAPLQAARTRFVGAARVFCGRVDVTETVHGYTQKDHYSGQTVSETHFPAPGYLAAEVGGWVRGEDGGALIFCATSNTYHSLLASAWSTVNKPRSVPLSTHEPYSEYLTDALWFDLPDELVRRRIPPDKLREAVAVGSRPDKFHFLRRHVLSQPPRFLS